MSTIGSDISWTYPTVGEANESPNWASRINTILLDIETTLEQKIGVGSITIDGALDLEEFALLDVAYTEYFDQSSNPTPTKTLYTKSGDLYFKDGGSNVVQITSNGDLSNAAANGIAQVNGSGSNDYGVAGVQLEWDHSALDYNFKDGSGSDDYATVTMGEIRLGDGSSNYAGLDAPSSMSSNVVYTLPSAAPGTSGTLLQSDTSGDLTFSNTVDSLTATNAITAGTGLTVTAGGATITAGGLTVTAGGATVVAGDVSIPEADVLHGSRSRFISPIWLYSNYIQSTGSIVSAYSGFLTAEGIGYFQFVGTGTGTDYLYWPLDAFIEYGQRITSVKIYTGGTWAGDAGFDIYDKINGTTFYSGGSIPSGTVSSSVTAGSLTITGAAGDVTLVMDVATSATRQIRGIEITYDRVTT